MTTRLAAMTASMRETRRKGETDEDEEEVVQREQQRGERRVIREQRRGGGDQLRVVESDALGGGPGTAHHPLVSLLS